MGWRNGGSFVERNMNNVENIQRKRRMKATDAKEPEELFLKHVNWIWSQDWNVLHYNQFILAIGESWRFSISLFITFI